MSSELHHDRPSEGGLITEEGDASDGGGRLSVVPQVLRVPIDSLQPNPINGVIYRESLREDLLGPLAESLRENGQREPITVDVAKVILDGERRWRALRLIGARWIDVIVDGTRRTPDDVEEYILHAYSQKRRPSVFERVNIYEALIRCYTRQHGRQRGRPKKTDTNVAVYWDSNRVRDTAAREVGFGSRETARRAQVIMRSDVEEVKARLEADTLSIDAAYRLVCVEDAPGEATPGSVGETTMEAPVEQPSAVDRGLTGSSASGLPRKSDSREMECEPNRSCSPSSSGAAAPTGAFDAVPVGDTPELRPAAAAVGSDEVVSGLAAASTFEQPGAKNLPTTPLPDALDVGFDINKVELDDLLFAACRKIEVIAQDPPDDLQYLVERAAQMLLDAGARNAQ